MGYEECTEVAVSRVEGEWSERKISDVAVIGRGKSKHRPRDAAFLFGGKYPFVQTGDIKNTDLYLTEYNQTYSDLGLKQSKLWDLDTLCITIAANIAETAILKIKACFPDSIIGLIPIKGEAEVTFIKYQFDKFKIEIQRLSQGVAQDNLNQEKLGNITFVFPDVNEQIKVASVLLTVDEKLSKLKKKKALLEKYKKGMMQKIFNREVRFKDEDGGDFSEWEELPMNKIFQRKTTKNKDGAVKTVLTNSAIRGIVLQQDYFDKEIANVDSIKTYYVVDQDDFVYNPRISEYAPVGPFKRNKLVRGIMSPLYSIFSVSKGNLDYYQYYFETILWHDYMFSIANFGARHDRMNIRMTDFEELPLPFPDLKEQTKIANFLSSIDDKIDLVAREIEKMEIWKKGLLGEMFV